MTTTRDDSDFDVVIIGGGMVGSALACALGSTPATGHLRVGLVETSVVAPLHPLPPTPDLRVVSVNPASARLLQAVGAWDAIVNARVAPFYSMKVWDTSGKASISFRHNEVGMDYLGFLVENRVITSALFERMQQLPSVKLFSPMSVQRIELEENGKGDKHEVDWSSPQPTVGLHLKNGDKLRTKLLIGADGAQSIVRQTFNFGAVGWQYSQRGVVATVTLPPHMANMTTAWQRFLPTGPVALLPLWDRYASIVWSTNLPHADHLLGLDEKAFLEELNHAFHDPPAATTGPLAFIEDKLPFNPFAGADPQPPVLQEVVGKRAAFPLRIAHATDYIRPRVALIGDAAHTIHPLAGQGVNLGFADVASLTNSVIDAVHTGRDVGDVSVLKQYEEDRRVANAVMLTAVDGLKRVWGTSFLPLAALRNVGLKLTDSFSPLKKEMMKFAVGSFDTSAIGAHVPDTTST